MEKENVFEGSRSRRKGKGADCKGVIVDEETAAVPPWKAAAPESSAKLSAKFVRKRAVVKEEKAEDPPTSEVHTLNSESEIVTKH